MVTIGLPDGARGKLVHWLIVMILAAWFVLEIAVFIYFIVLITKKGL